MITYYLVENILTRGNDTTSACRLKRTVVASQLLMLLLCIDVLIGTLNAVASPGAISILRGSLLSFDPTNPDQVVFRAPANGTDPAVRVSTYSLIKPQEVHFLCPEAPTGDYTLAVRCLSRNGKVQLPIQPEKVPFPHWKWQQLQPYQLATPAL